MTVNPLSAGPVATLIAKSLPAQAEPQLRTPVEAVAVACHAGMLSVGFKLIGLAENRRLDTPSTSTDPTPLPADWNATSDSSLTFQYTHPQSSMQYLLKVSKLGAKTLIHGIGMGDDKTAHLDVTTKDHISESALPASPTNAATSPEDATHAITGIYITPSRLTDLGSSLRLNIIQRLVPSLHKEGYEDTSQSSTSTSSQRRDDGPPRNPRDPAYAPPMRDPLAEDPHPPARPNPLADPSVGPRRPAPAPDFPPPGFEDPYDVHRGPRNGGAGGGLRMPGYGERDLYPPGLGPRDPLGGGLGGRGGGGMYMDFEDLDPDRGGGGGVGDMRRPPGARWDPTGPTGDGPPFDPLMGDQPPRRGPGGGGFPRFGGAGGAPPNPFGGFGSGDFI